MIEDAGSLSSRNTKDSRTMPSRSSSGRPNPATKSSGTVTRWVLSSSPTTTSNSRSPVGVTLMSAKTNRLSRRGRAALHGGRAPGAPLRLPGGKDATADGGPDHDPRAHEHQVLDDVLAFEGGGVRKLREDLAGKEQKGRRGADHLEGQEQQRDAHEPAGDQSHSYGALQGGEQHEADAARHESERERVYGLEREGLRRAEAGEELEHAEPEEHDAQRHAERHDAVAGHPLRELCVY